MEKEKYYYKLASPEYIKQAGKAFDEQLAHQAAGKFDNNHVYHVYKLGYPGEILQAAGFPDDKIENPKFSMENVIIMEDFYDESKFHIANVVCDDNHKEQIEGNNDKINIQVIKSAVIQRLSQPTIQGRLSDEQIKVLNGYRQMFPDEPIKDVFVKLFKEMDKELRRNYIGRTSVDDLLGEIVEISQGIRRNDEINCGRSK